MNVARPAWLSVEDLARIVDRDGEGCVECRRRGLTTPEDEPLEAPLPADAPAPPEPGFGPDGLPDGSVPLSLDRATGRWTPTSDAPVIRSTPILADALGGDDEELSDVAVAREAARRLRRLRDAALAYRDLATCYRLGRTPSERLHARLDRAAATLRDLAPHR